MLLFTNVVVNMLWSIINKAKASLRILETMVEI